MLNGPIDHSKRRISFRKATGWLHLWLGLASGLIVYIVAVTGCIYVFEKEIMSMVYADRMYVKPAGSPLPLSELWEKAQAALGEEHRIQRVHLHDDADRSYAFGSYKSDPKAWTYFGEQVHNFQVFVNPYDGKVVRIENSKYEFFNLVVWLHWSLLLSDKVGQPIVGTAVLIFVIMLLTGLVLWWPRNRAALKARLRIAWRAKWRRLNWDLHSVPGFYAMSIALLIALTGLVWAFDWFDNSVYFVATGGARPVKETPLVSDTTVASRGRPLDAILARVRAESPGFRELYLSVPDKDAGVVSAFVRFGEHVNYRTRRLQFDQFSGVLLKRRDFSDQNRGEKLRSLNYDLHVGSILGLPGKILAFFASLVCATLPVSGLLIWLGKRRKHSSPPAGRRSRGRRPSPSEASRQAGDSRLRSPASAKKEAEAGNPGAAKPDETMQQMERSES